METNIFNNISVWKGQVTSRDQFLSQHPFSIFSWPHEYKYMKVQQYHNWIYFLILALWCRWIFNIISPSKHLIQEATLRSFTLFWRLHLPWVQVGNTNGDRKMGKNSHHLKLVNELIFIWFILLKIWSSSISISGRVTGQAARKSDLMEVKIKCP